ncbi:MAG: hypothetical protein ACK5XN_37050 [Bacteroidota bacterium]
MIIFKLLFIKCQKHTIGFKVAHNFNDGRGVEILIIAVYSEIVKNDISSLISEKNIEKIQDICSNNYNMLEIYRIDINPYKKIQTKEVELSDRLLCCFILFYGQKDTSYLIIDKENFKDEILILCSKSGIKFE